MPYFAVAAALSLTPAQVQTPPENLQILWNQFMDLEYETIATDYFVEQQVYPVETILPSFKKLLLDVPIATNATMSYWVDTTDQRHELDTGEDYAVGYRNDHTPLKRSFYLETKAIDRNMKPFMMQFGVAGAADTTRILATGIYYNGQFYEGYIDENAQFHEGKFVRFPRATHTSSKPSATFAKTATIQGMPIKTITKTVAVGSSYQLKVASNYPWYKPYAYTLVNYDRLFKYGTKKATIPYQAYVIALSKNGYIQAKKVGSSVVDVQYSQADGDFHAVIVNVVNPVTSLTAPTSLTVKSGRSIVLKVKANGTKPSLTYKSANTKIATVDSKGKVVGKKKGTTRITITAKTKDGSNISKKLTLTVH